MRRLIVLAMMAANSGSQKRTMRATPLSVRRLLWPVSDTLELNPRIDGVFLTWNAN